MDARLTIQNSSRNIPRAVLARSPIFGACELGNSVVAGQGQGNKSAGHLEGGKVGRSAMDAGSRSRNSARAEVLRVMDWSVAGQSKTCGHAAGGNCRHAKSVLARMYRGYQHAEDASMLCQEILDRFDVPSRSAMVRRQSLQFAARRGARLRYSRIIKRRYQVAYGSCGMMHGHHDGAMGHGVCQ